MLKEEERLNNTNDNTRYAKIVCNEEENESFTIIKNYHKESFVPHFNQVRYLKGSKNAPWAVRNLNRYSLTSLYDRF